jgi:hypothetical protein
MLHLGQFGGKNWGPIASKIVSRHNTVSEPKAACIEFGRARHRPTVDALSPISPDLQRAAGKARLPTQAAVTAVRRTMLSNWAAAAVHASSVQLRRDKLWVYLH